MHLTPDELEIIGMAHELEKSGLHMPDIKNALRAPAAMQVACRWAALGGDSRIMVEYALIQEERRNETGPALPNRNLAPPESGTERERRKEKI